MFLKPATLTYPYKHRKKTRKIHTGRPQPARETQNQDIRVIHVIHVIVKVLPKRPKAPPRLKCAKLTTFLDKNEASSWAK